MFRRLALALPAAAFALAATALPAAAAETAATAKKVVSKASSSRKQLKSEAKGMALATNTVDQITAGQLDAAARVLTGTSDCEFGQSVDIEAESAKPGHLRLHFKKAVYSMVPEETTTGAVRLEDKKNGIVWIQIPAKSMLMNAKVGQRLVDGCMHGEQRAAVQAAAAAAQSPDAPKK